MATTTATATATATGTARRTTTTTTMMTTTTTTTTTRLATKRQPSNQARQPSAKQQQQQRQRDAQTRPARSNSLQRMLELEKQCVLERRHAVRALPSSPPKMMQPTPPTTSMLPAPRPSTHSRQYSAEQRKHFLEESVSGQLRMQQQSRPPPLKISTHVNGATPRTNTTSTTASTDFKSDLPAPYSPPSTVHPKAKPPTKPKATKGQPQEAQSSPLSSSSGMLPQPNKLPTGPKTVTFHEQPLSSNPSTVVAAAASLSEDRNSICQSPSWEAYARRKKEKKNDKEQRLDKEAKPPNSSKTKPRVSKLSHSHSASEPTLPTQQPAQIRSVKFAQRPEDTTSKARRASTIGLPVKQTPPQSAAPDTKQPPTRRIRSNSLSSIFRSPFESHRPSLDRNSGGFIGGIKLEHQRLVAYQRALNEEAIGASGDIHPAFRKHNKRSSSPLRFLVPKTGPKDAQDRAYPPISIRTSHTAQGLIPQNSEAMPEGRMSRWRAHFGLKTEPKPQKLNKSPTAEREQNLGSVFSRRNASSPALPQPPSDQMRYSPSMAQLNGTDKPTASSPSNPQQLAPAAPNAARTSSPLARSINNELDDSRSEADSPPSFTTAPPSPPQKVSKRQSMASLGDADTPRAESPRPSGPRRAQTGFPSTDSERYVGDSSSTRARSASRAKRSDPLSIPYNATEGAPSKRPVSRGLFDAARSVLGRSAHPPLPPTPTLPITSQSRPTSRSKNSPYLTASTKEHEMRSASFSNFQTLHNPKRINDRRKTMNTAAPPANSSSVDSYSGDDFRSSFLSGTPDTSRPVSERVDGFDHIAEARAALERPHSPAFSTSGASAVDLNPVQSAAMKVLAAFPDLPPPTRPGMGRRTESMSSVQSVLIPRIKQQNGQQKDANKAKSIKAAKIDDDKAPALRDLIMSKDESSAAAPWPASYLEAARKAAPAKDGTKTPPASKSPPKLPAQPPPPMPATIPSAPPSVKATSPPRSRKSSDSTPGVRSASIDGEPVAKMLVQCCSCKCYHDMPSSLYEAMNNPDAILDLEDHTEFAGSISMSIKCPWCKHDMNTKCCAGYAAILYVQERLH